MERIDSDLPDWPVPDSVVADVFDPPKVAYGETWDQEDDFLVARDRCGPRHAHLPPGPPPDWLHGPLEAVVGDFTRAGGAPDGLTLSYSPNGAGGTVWVTHRLPDRWGFGVALPPCPDHPHAAIAVVRDGAAWWICPATDRLLAPVGSYAPERRAAGAPRRCRRGR